MNKEIAETYEEYLAGAKQVAGLGRLSCYQGLQYLEKYIQKDEFYSEKLEDTYVSIQSHIKRIEKENTNLKQALNEIREEIIKWDESSTCAIDDYFLKENILQIIDKVDLGDEK